jgi:hypothetical protein
MRRLAAGAAPFVLVVALYFLFAAFAGSPDDEAGDTGGPTTLASTTSTTTVGSAPGEGAWSLLPAQTVVEVHAWHLSTTTTTTAPPPPPPPPPEPKPPTRPTQGGSSVEQLICAQAWDCGTALAVARCESGLNPAAVSPGGANLGLFQVNTVHRGRWEAMGYSQADMLTAGPNIAVARSLWAEQGWGPWSCAR